MDWIAQESGVAYGETEHATKAHRVLADHGRGMTFLVGDGVMPSNEGRGYVLRRIIRRAVQQAQAIGLDELWRLTDVVVEQMGDAVPGAAASTRARSSACSAEEERFAETLERGMKLFEERRRSGATQRRGRVHAARHVRVPDRADARARARARPAGRRGRLPRS